MCTVSSYTISYIPLKGTGLIQDFGYTVTVMTGEGNF